MVRLAKKYELSDVGLAKMCRRYNIPRPYPGYWAKKESGVRTTPTPLPEPEENSEIRFQLRNDGRILRPEVRAAIKKEILKEDSKKQEIKVGENLRQTHPLVCVAREQLEQAEVNEDRLLILPQDHALSITVSKRLLRRALLIMDALLKSLEEVGYNVNSGPEVEIGGVRITFSITEALDSKKGQPDKFNLEGSYQFWHSKFVTKYIPSGRLTLRINEGDAYWAGGCRKYWRDSEKTKIEERLGSFIAGLAEVAIRKKEYDLACAEEEAQKREKERKQAELARARADKLARRKDEEKRVEALIREVSDWKKSQDLKAYINAKKEVHEARREGVQNDDEFNEWVKWAEMQVKRLNPLAINPPSILDESLEEEPELRNSW